MSPRIKSSARLLALVLVVALAVLGLALAAHAAPTLSTTSPAKSVASTAVGATISAPGAVVAQPLATTKYVYITNTGKKYHRNGCRYLKRSKKKVTLKWAKAHGYTACKVCKPPKN